MRGGSLPQWILSLPRVPPYGSASYDASLAHQSNEPISAWSAVSSSSSCCEALTKALGSTAVAYSNDAAYQESTSSYFSLKNVDIHPSCVVLPESAQEVATAVRTLTLGASTWPGKCQFGIRGGGHTPWAAAAVEKGIVIDLLHLPRPGYVEEDNTILVSPSQTWDQVYEELDFHGRSTLGAKVAGVGVGGGIVAGGVSYFSPRFGFMCDMVENYEVVLATGDIVNANARENSDLWRAMRGGHNNFGIVTQAKLGTFPQKAFWGGQTFHSIDTRERHFKALADLASAHPYDPYAHYISTMVLNNFTRSWSVGNSLQYTASDPPVPRPKVFEPMLEIPQTAPMPGAPPNTLRVDNVTSFSREYAAVSTYPKRWQFAVFSFGPDAEFMEYFFQKADEAMKPFVGLPGFLLAMNYQTVPNVQAERRGAVDSLGPIQTEGDIVFVHWALSVDDSEANSDAPIQAAVQKLFAAAESEAKTRGLYRAFLTPTYADSWQNPIARRSDETVKGLWAASKKYDPLQVFQKQVPGGFKLPPMGE